MTNDLLISFIVPVYNRPYEIRDLLESLTRQIDKRFEVVIVEDGSSFSSEKIVEEYLDLLRIIYKVTSNGGPSRARNIGASLSFSPFLIFLDSDTVLPPHYTKIVIEA